MGDIVGRGESNLFLFFHQIFLAMLPHLNYRSDNDRRACSSPLQRVVSKKPPPSYQYEEDETVSIFILFNKMKFSLPRHPMEDRHQELLFNKGKRPIFIRRLECLRALTMDQ